MVYSSIYLISRGRKNMNKLTASQESKVDYYRGKGYEIELLRWIGRSVIYKMRPLGIGSLGFVAIGPNGAIEETWTE